MGLRSISPRTRTAKPRTARPSILGSAAVAVILSASSAWAEKHDASSAARETTSETTFLVPRRAHRETLLSNATEISHRAPLERSDVAGWTTASPLEPASTPSLLRETSGLRIGEIRLSVKNPTATTRREVIEHRCEAVQRAWSNDGRNATASTQSPNPLGAVGWLVGAVGVGLGAFLLVSGGKESGTETAIQADFFRRGAGLRVRRAW